MRDIIIPEDNQGPREIFETEIPETRQSEADSEEECVILEPIPDEIQNEDISNAAESEDNASTDTEVVILDQTWTDDQRELDLDTVIQVRVGI